MFSRSGLVALLLVLASAGCVNEETPRVEGSAASQPAATRAQSGEEPPPVPSPAAPPPPSAPPAPAAAQAPAAGDPPAPGEARVAAEGTVANTQTMEQVGTAIEGAIAAAAAIPANGDSRCVLAYRSLEAMLTRLQRDLPNAPSRQLPPRDRFVEVCNEMPAELQQCLVISYAVEHQAECQQASDNMDPALRARVEGMMQSGEPAAP